LADQVVDKSIDSEAHRLSFAQTSLLHVEYLFGTDLADASFMLRRVTGPAHRDRRIGVRPAGLVNQQGVALGVVLTAPEMFRYVDQTTIGCATFADANTFRNYVAGGLISSVNHFGAGILVLAISRQRDADDLAASLSSLQYNARIFHRQPGSDVAIDPFDLGSLQSQSTLCDEVKDVWRPVLNGDVLDLRAGKRDQFNNRGVESSRCKFRRRTALHVHHFRAFVRDDQCPFKLPEIFRIDSEVSLQRMFHLHARGDINKTSPAEDCAIQRAELVVTSRDDFPEPFSKKYQAAP